MWGMSILNTPSAVIDALGGPTRTARLVGRSPNAVWNWRERGFPPETYLVCQRLLSERGLRAPARLWRMAEPPKLENGSDERD